jgi:hypothetical protein
MRFRDPNDVLVTWFLCIVLGTLTTLIGLGLWKLWEMMR